VLTVFRTPNGIRTRAAAV